MKIMHINNIDKFFEMIDGCEGKVELVGDDIRLNLKSKIAQIVGLANIFAAGYEIPELEIVAYNQNDVNRIIQYMVNGGI